MKARSWVKLFMTTLMLGGVTTLVFGLIIKWNELALHFSTNNLGGVGYLFLWLIGTGFTFSVVSQMGFFAYLTIHRFGLGLFRSRKLWNGAQWVLMAFIIGDILFLRVISGGEAAAFLMDSLMVLFTIAVGVWVAFRKSRETNPEVFTSALFFMVFVTIVEWLPAVRVGDSSWMFVMLLTLLVCNAYQMLILHRITMNETAQRTKTA